MVKYYLKIAWRNIDKHRVFSLINAGGLTLGITSCLLLMLFVFYHLNFDHQFKDLGDIYIIENNQFGGGKIYTFPSTSGQVAYEIKSEVPGVTQTARSVSFDQGNLIKYNDNSFKKAGMYVDASFFSIFSYHFIMGNPANALVNPNSVVITESLAKTLFGDQYPMDKIINFNNQVPLIVTGVIDDIPENESYQFDFLMPWALFENSNPWINNSDFFCQTFVKLKNNSYYAKANKIISSSISKNSKGGKNQLFLFPIEKYHLYDKFENGKSTGGMIDKIHLFEILAICILFIACINYMNLSTARSEERTKEVGIRKVIGSGRISLIWQFIIESLMISFLATVAAILLVLLLIPFFNTLLRIKMIMPVEHWQAWLIILGLSIVTGIVSGSYPAFYLSSTEPIKVLKGVYKGGKRALSVRKVLVIIQFAFAVFLITSTICIYRQIYFIQNKSTGYDKRNLVEIPVEGNLRGQTEYLINELKEKRAITSGTTLSTSITGNSNKTWKIDWPGKQVNQKILFDILNVGFDFSKTFGIKLVAGREFSNQYPLDTANETIIINEASAQAMNLKYPVGTRIKWSNNIVTIVGVFKDFVRTSPYEKVPPTIMSYVGNGGLALDLKLNRKMTIASSVGEINEILKEINPGYTTKISFVDQNFAKKFENEQTLAYLSNIFGTLAIIVSCLGLFGLTAFAAERRAKEIGVRKVLGATINGLIALLTKDFLKLIIAAILIAIPTSIWVLNAWLNQYEYRTSLDWWIFVLASIITLTIALLTVSYQAVKAALNNPVKSLKSE